MLPLRPPCHQAWPLSWPSCVGTTSQRGFSPPSTSPSLFPGGGQGAGEKSTCPLRRRLRWPWKNPGSQGSATPVTSAGTFTCRQEGRREGRGREDRSHLQRPEPERLAGTAGTARHVLGHLHHLFAQRPGRPHHLPRCALHPRNDLRGPRLDPGGLREGHVVHAARLGDVCLCALLPHVHHPPVPLPLWGARWQLLLDHLGCHLSGDSCSLLPQCRRAASLCHLQHQVFVCHLAARHLPGEHRCGGICILSYPDVCDPYGVLAPAMEVGLSLPSQVCPVVTHKHELFNDCSFWAGAGFCFSVSRL